MSQIYLILVFHSQPSKWRFCNKFWFQSSACICWSSETFKAQPRMKLTLGVIKIKMTKHVIVWTKVLTGIFRNAAFWRFCQFDMSVRGFFAHTLTILLPSADLHESQSFWSCTNSSLSIANILLTTLVLILSANLLPHIRI
jgi:hypothetical protein